MMHQTLDELAGLRQALITSDDASLAQLRQVDRRILSRAEQGDPSCPVSRGLGGDSLERLEVMPVKEATLWLEVAVLLEGIRVRPALDALTRSGPGRALSWWLAAHYPGLTAPDDFPESPEQQVLAAKARWRRGQGASLPSPWREWAAVMDRRAEPSRELVESLWDLISPETETTGLASWKDWFYPLMVDAHDEWQLWMVNWLLAEADTVTTVEAMGVTCARRFLSWLEAIGAGTGHDDNEVTARAAGRELRWLWGNREGRGPETSPFGYQCWGQILPDGHGLAPLSWQSRFNSLPLGYRDRCWHWSGRHIHGAPWSLFGGQWCAGG